MRASIKIARQVLFWSIILAIILIPFFIFGKQIEEWTESIRSGSTSGPVAAWIMGALLASDILLPIPSSLASTACGYLAGVLQGTLISFLGMSVSSLAGYWLGRKPGSFAFYRSLGANEAEKMRRLNKRFGPLLLLIARPVPVLAEASVFFAGLSHMRFRPFIIIVSLSNLGISAVYAMVGAFSADLNSFLLAFGASMALPLVFILFSTLFTKR